MTGHLLGAAGAVETVISALVCQNGLIPPTINFTTPDPACDLNYSHNQKTERNVEYAISNSFGFGGHNRARSPTRPFCFDTVRCML
jgi:3-oxoacyl-[acyl-carrier-protein] synthase II